MTFPISYVRDQFPALARPWNDQPRIYADNPAGTQVPAMVAQAIADRMLGDYSNLGGAFAASESCDALYLRAHDRAAEFLGALSGREIVIGQSMTSLTFHMSRSICRDFQPGDEIVVTRMEHEGNVGAWLEIAKDKGLVIRWAPFDTDSWQVEPEALAAVLTDRTRLVCLNHASNMTGAINDVAALTACAKEVDAFVYVDSVQYAPHHLPDVQALGCDFLVCSAYKIFGPHLGILWAREDLLHSMYPYKGRCVSDDLPERFESGTPQLELLAGLVASYDYLADLGAKVGSEGSNRAKMAKAFEESLAHEAVLTSEMIQGLQDIPGLQVYGITSPNQMAHRVPTVSVRVEGCNPHNMAASLARQGIFAWSGHNYAYEPARQLGLPLDEGVLRLGLAHYNTSNEVARIVTAVADSTGT
jgi:cysteine desulfurase family protein (TIGR01976 family)